VDDLFAPPDSAWERVSPSLATMRRVVLLIVAGVLVLAVVVLALLLDLPLWVLALAAAADAVLVGFGWWAVGRNVARWGYAERDEDLYITRGAFFRQLVVVPYGRMQYVDVQAGPLDRAYGIARVHLHTASPGTSASIPGLPKDEAARLRDRLTSLGEAQAAGL
jgi:uncharacterized protein